MKVINILLVEDDELDTIDIKRSLDKMNILYKLHVAKNGEEAIALLKSCPDTSSPTFPNIAIIDINMPRMNGLEFLSVIRSTEEWKNLKSFVLTTSAEKVDREAAEKFGISGYIVKPLKLNNPSSIDAFNLMIDLMNMKD
ncbi:MAG: response regulator receiver protein [Segetibacter sp.]|nr:response regulator receiver protein [Segetibacter sp.]